jgi:hypothetical protein
MHGVDRFGLPRAFSISYVGNNILDKIEESSEAGGDRAASEGDEEADDSGGYDSALPLSGGDV